MLGTPTSYSVPLECAVQYTCCHVHLFHALPSGHDGNVQHVHPELLPGRVIGDAAEDVEDGGHREGVEEPALGDEAAGRAHGTEEGWLEKGKCAGAHAVGVRRLGPKGVYLA